MVSYFNLNEPLKDDVLNPFLLRYASQFKVNYMQKKNNENAKNPQYFKMHTFNSKMSHCMYVLLVWLFGCT